MTWYIRAEFTQVTTVLTPHELATAPPTASGLPLAVSLQGNSVHPEILHALGHEYHH